MPTGGGIFTFIALLVVSREGLLAPLDSSEGSPSVVVGVVVVGSGCHYWEGNGGPSDLH